MCSTALFVQLCIRGNLNSGAERWSKQEASALGRIESPLTAFTNVQWVRFGDLVIGVQLHLRCLKIAKVSIHLCVVDVTRTRMAPPDLWSSSWWQGKIPKGSSSGPVCLRVATWAMFRGLSRGKRVAEKPQACS